MSPIKDFFSKVQNAVKPLITIKSGYFFIIIILGFMTAKWSQDFTDFAMIFVELTTRFVSSPVALVILSIILILICIISRDIKFFIEKIEIQVLVNFNISDQNEQPSAPGIVDRFVGDFSQEREFN